MIHDLIKELSATNGPIQKVNALKRYNYQGIKDILFYTYNPYFVYGLGKARLDNCESYSIMNVDSLTFKEQSVLEGLIHRKVTGHAAVAAVEQEVQIHGGLLYYIITKDLRCGISTAIINKAFPKLIPTFAVQLAKEVSFEKLSYPCAAEIKYDGVRLIAIKEMGQVKFVTRNGKEVTLPKLKAEFLHVGPGVYDGEIVTAERNRTSVSGRINSAIHGGAIDESDLRYMLFDKLTLKEFSERKSRTAYKQRRVELEDWFIGIKSNYIKLADSVIVESKPNAESVFNDAIGAGHEGIILKDLTSYYEFKRSKSWAKFKTIATADLKCIGVQEGQGKYEGQIGALICVGEVGDKFIEVNVGSGLDDADRELDSSHYFGATIEVKYNEVIPNFEKDGFTLFLPRFVCVRFDK